MSVASVRQGREHIVMAAAQDVSFHFVIFGVSATNSQITHFAIEHGDSRGSSSDEPAQLLFPLAQSRFRMGALQDRPCALGCFFEKDWRKQAPERFNVIRSIKIGAWTWPRNPPQKYCQCAGGGVRLLPSPEVHLTHRPQTRPFLFVIRRSILYLL